jgi:hypothetical protein
MPGSRAAIPKRRSMTINIARSGPPRYELVRVMGRQLPPLHVCRAAFDKLTGVKRAWPEYDEERERSLLREEGDDGDV